MARIKFNQAEHAVRMFYRQQQTLNAHVESAKCLQLRVSGAKAAGHNAKILHVIVSTYSLKWLMVSVKETEHVVGDVGEASGFENER